MAFQAMDTCDNQIFHDRSCIILYHFNGKELKILQNAARMSGIKDQILLTSDQAETVVRDVLNNERKEGSEGVKEKAVIFNNVTSMRMNLFIDSLKKCRMARPLMAVVTESSIEWTVNELVGHLMEERKAVRSNEFGVH